MVHPPPLQPPTPPFAYNRHALNFAYRTAADTHFRPCLEDLHVSGAKRSRHRWKLDVHNNVLFPHEDKRGLCGFEVESQGFTGFAGELRGFWRSVTAESDEVLVIAKSAI